MQLSQPQHSHLSPTHHHSAFKLIYPPSSLHHTSIQNAKRIHHLEHLIRAERQELQRLLVHNNNHKRSRHSSPSSSSAPTTPSLSTTMPVPTTPPALSSPTPQTSPKGIMDTYQPSTHAPPRKPQIREMAARGSHWSFVEKARFEAALHKYGPFAWDQIIRTVGSRSEKQVKAYAARYRRRKKLAAKAQLEAAELLPIQKPTSLAPSLSTLHSLHRPLRPSPTPPPPPPPPPPPLPPPTTTEQQTSQSCQNPPMLEPLHIEGLLPSDSPSADESAFCDDLFSGTSLFDAPLVDSTEQLPDVNQPNQTAEVELLVDQALRGDYVLDDKPPEEERDAEPLPDAFPTDFLNTVFTH